MIQWIIEEGVSNQIAFNIMILKDPKEIWDKLKSVCIKVGQGVVYLIIQKLFYYPKINKPKRYKKPVMQIFAEVQYFCKRLQIIITSSCNLCNIIAIVILLDSLDENFDIITTSLQEIENKTIDQILSILQFKEVKDFSKQVTKNIEDLAMAFREKNGGVSSKKKPNSYNECYNCYKLRHFGWDYFLLDKKLNKIIQQSRNKDSHREDWQKNRSRI